MTEKTGLHECKILRFPDRTPKSQAFTWGELTGLPKEFMTTAAVIPEPLTNKHLAEVFTEMVERAVEQSKFSSVPVYLLVETAVRQHRGLNIQAAVSLSAALKALRKAHDEQQERLR